MVYPLLIGSTLLRTQRTKLPPTFIRYKSLTAAIERGRQGGLDRPSRLRTRRTFEDTGNERVKTRREKRFERFGPPRDNDNAPQSSREERPRRDRGDRVTAPRSSRFGSDSGPSRFREGQPQRDRDGPPRRFRREHFDSVPDRSGRSDRRSEGGREPWSDGGDTGGSRNERFNARNRIAPRKERPSSVRGGRNFDRGKSFGNSGDSYSSAMSQREGSGDVNECLRESRFSHRPDSKGARREQTHASSRKPADSPSGTRTSVEAQSNSVRGPESLPYTTAASEFIYGHSSVLAAIKANRRKLYSLYIHSRGASRDGLMARIRANKLFSITKEVGDEYLRAMDKASSGRPHNGVILEASALPVPPITELKTASIKDESFSIALDSQSAEDAAINGKQELYSYQSAGWRHPLILYVDGVVSHLTVLYFLYLTLPAR